MEDLPTLRFAVLGAGPESRFHLAAWREIHGAECVALYDHTKSNAAALGHEFGVSAVYDDVEALLQTERPAFVVISDTDEASQPLVEAVVRQGIPIIYYSLQAPTLEQARALASTCEQAKVPLFVHENWRWQTPLRQLQKALKSKRIGQPFRARLDFITSFPIFDRQPDLKEHDQLILHEVGTHLLDVARFLFGEAQSVYAVTRRIRKDITGEDVATVVLEMNGVTLTCNMSYASRTQHERFPQTFAFVEGSAGSVELSTDCWIHITNEYGTLSKRHAPPQYAWVDPEYQVVQAAGVDCNRNLLHGLQTNSVPETHAADYLRTVELVSAAYESAQSGQVVAVAHDKA